MARRPHRGITPLRTTVVLALLASTVWSAPVRAEPGVPPEVVSILESDQDIDPGETRTYKVAVAGYDSGGTWTFSGTGVTATVARERAGSVKLSVTATESAEAGMRSLTVANPDGLSHTYADAITVTGATPSPLVGDVSGHVFHDADGDGVEDPTEAGLAGVLVSATDSGGATASTTTGASGDFTITDLEVGATSVWFVPPAGYSLTTGNATQTVSVVEASTATVAAVGYQPGEIPDAPNFVVIVTDDQRWDTIGRCLPAIDALDFDADADACMPNLQDLVMDAGTTFLLGEVTQALCCPSRASILTGQYSTTHGVTNNAGGDLDDASTIATWLDDVGYRAGLFGKYLNGYGFGTLAEYVPPGWDAWHAFHAVGGGRGVYDDYDWIDWDQGDAAPVVNHYNDNDSLSDDACAPGNYYSTDFICRHALDFLEADATTPFFLYAAPVAPHSPLIAADRHLGAFAGITPAVYPSYDTIPSPNPPSYLSTQPLRANHFDFISDQLQDAAETVLSVDDLVGALHAQLAADGRLANTVWVFISDNGFAFGEHRLSAKRCEYLECHRVPFVVACPRTVCNEAVPGSVDSENYALNVDIAPTVAELAGASPTIAVDGRSLVPILEDPASPWRTEWFLHDTGPNADGIVAVASDGHIYKYVELTSTGETEMYDLDTDPWELSNLAGNSAYAFIEAGLAGRLSDHLEP